MKKDELTVGTNGFAIRVATALNPSRLSGFSGFQKSPPVRKFNVACMFLIASRPITDHMETLKPAAFFSLAVGLLFTWRKPRDYKAPDEAGV